MSDWLQKIRYSLFLRILMLFVSAFVLVVLSWGITHELFFDDLLDSGVKRLVTNYANYIVDDIGIPPDTTRARSVADDHELIMRIQNPRYEWINHPEAPDFEELEMSEYQNGYSRRVEILDDDAGLGIELLQGDNRYLLIYKPKEWRFGALFWLQTGINLTIVLLIVTGLFVITSRLLAPIRTLRKSVGQVTKGDYEIDLPTKRTDELGQLVKAFDEMAGSIKQRIKARDQLLLDISHELRSPLTRIKVALEFIEDSGARQSIISDVNETELMIAEILETERLDSSYGELCRQQIDLVEMVEEVTKPFVDQEPGIAILGGADQVLINLDPARIQTVLNNLITNAVKYSAKNAPAIQKPVEISVADNGGEVHVKIQDYGMGIPKQELPYIFEPFYRVDKARTPQGGGYGLGLSLVKKIVDAHDGRIEISSEVGVGTCVVLFFPRREN